MKEEIRRFVHDLHFDIDRIRPPDWETDWEDAPLPYKLYRGRAVFPLSAEIPLTLKNAREGVRANVRDVAHLLWYSYGITAVSRAAVPPDLPPEWTGLSETYRRVVPSGGGLYPNELYAYLKLPELPRGVYHYDAAHHRLVLLREGDFDDVLNFALGDRYNTAACFGAVLVTAVYWKNFFKYASFAYRLQGLDAGVLLGQMLEAGSRFGYKTRIVYQFLDRVLGRLLGLVEGTESVLAVMLLSEGDIAAGPVNRDSSAAAERLGRLPEVRFDICERSRNIKPYPLLVRMDEASRIESPEAMVRLPAHSPPPRPEEAPVVPLPRRDRVPCDFAELSRKRYSPETDFVLRPVSLPDLAALLQETAAASRYCSDLGTSGDAAWPRATLCGCFYGVKGLADGAYRYDMDAHSLALLRPGDHRAWLHYGMTLHNVNVFQVPLVFHVTGDREHGFSLLGARGYRIQQMEAGILTQRLLLAASALGWGGRPLLGYEAEAIDDLYRLQAAGETALIQVPVGPYRRRARWEGALHR